MNYAHLEAVEDLVCVRVDNTKLARLAEPKAVEAPERGIAGPATMTGGGFSPQVLRFVFDQLVGNFVWKNGCFLTFSLLILSLTS